MRSIWRTLDRDLARGIAVICLSVGVIGVSYGAVAVSAGFPLWVPVLTAALVLAASSEFLFIGIIAAGGSPIAAVAAGLLVNARHLTYGLALPDVIEPGWRRLAGTHLMNDESVVLALAQPDPARKRAAYWAAGAGIAVCWPGGALAGALIGQAAHGTGALGLDAVFPAATLALILPALRDRGLRRAALAGAAIALAAVPFLPAGLPELLALAAVGVRAASRLMHRDLILLAAALALAAGTFAFRLAGPLLRARVTVSARTQELLETAAVVLLAALVATTALTSGPHLAGAARPLGVLAGGTAAWRKAPFWLVVLIAAGTTALLRLAGV